MKGLAEPEEVLNGLRGATARLAPSRINETQLGEAVFVHADDGVDGCCCWICCFVWCCVTGSEAILMYDRCLQARGDLGLKLNYALCSSLRPFRTLARTQ